jgi:hypothetical protein
MDYFVSIENTPYFRWQTELLIESFKIQGLQDQLVIAIAEHDEPQMSGYTRNLSVHNRKFAHYNYGKEKGYKYLNRPFSLYSALYAGLLKQPFTLIHPDMLLLKPVPEPEHENVLFHLENIPSPALRKLILPYLDKILKAKEIDIDKTNAVSMNGSVMFDCVPHVFFARVLERMETMIKEFPQESMHTYRAAWIITFYEYFNLMAYHGTHLDKHLTSKHEANFLHYRFGMPPNFVKQNYQFNGMQFSLTKVPSDPYTAMRSLTESSSHAKMCEIIDSYQVGEQKKP